jgi:hypothetical protein
MRFRASQRLSLVSLLAITLVAAPWLPAFAAPAPAVGSTNTVCAHGHDGNDVSSAVPAATGADADASCAQHEGCASQCCAACLHCAAAPAYSSPDDAPPVPSVKSPIVPLLVISSLPTGLIRPPQIDCH